MNGSSTHSYPSFAPSTHRPNPPPNPNRNAPAPPIRHPSYGAATGQPQQMRAVSSVPQIPMRPAPTPHAGGLPPPLIPR